MPCSAGRIPKWPTGADCKSAGLRLRWFESSSYHHFLIPAAFIGSVAFYFGPIQVSPCDNSRDSRDARANQVGQGGMKFEQGRGKNRGDDASEAARALSDAHGFALLVLGRENGDQAKQRRAMDAGTGGKDRERDEQGRIRCCVRDEHQTEGRDDQRERKQLP